MSRRSASSALLALALSGACVPRDELPDTRPADLALVGSVCGREAACAERETGGGLRPPPPAGQPLIFAVSRGDPWWALGYRDADFAGRALPDAATLLREPLQPIAADACWSLPRPSWSAALDEAAADQEAPAVTASWSRTCPIDEGSRWFDVRCPRSQLLCGLTSARQPGCIQRLDPERCPSFAPRIAVQYDGSTCALPEDRPGDCTVTAGPEGGTRWRCADCTLDLYRPTPPRAFVVHTATIGPPLSAPPVHFAFEHARLRDLVTGSPRALGVRDDRVALAIDLAAERSDGRCPFSVAIPHRVQLRDTEDLRILSDTATTACVSVLVPDPHGTGFVGAYYQGSELKVARLDREGRWSDRRLTTRLRPPGFDAPISGGRAMLTVTSAAIVVAEELEFTTTTRNTSWLHVLDPVTLVPTGPGQPVNDEISGVAAVGEDEVIVALARSMTLEVRPARSPVPMGRSAVLFGSSRPALPLSDDEGRVYVVDFSSPQALLHVDTTTPPAPSVIGAARTFEAPSLMLSTVVHGGPTSFLASALVPRPGNRFESVLVVIDREGDDLRVRPGMYTVQHDGAPLHGPLFQLQHDGRGRVWGVAPWAGVLVRIDGPL